MKLVAAKCPSCNANIEVDKNSDSTKCEFCDTKIIVEDAIAKYKVELSGEVSIKNMPKLDNYLKLGERHYDDGEYEEAYENYSKVVELDPDNWLAILRKGICKSLCTNYLNFEIKPTVNGVKNAYSILKEGKKTEEIDQAIKEANQTFSQLVAFVVNYYRSNELYIDDVSDANGKLLACINAYVYLNSIVEKDETKKVILTSLTYAIDRLLEAKRYNTGRYNNYAKPIIAYSSLNPTQKKHWTSMKTQYIHEKNMLDPEYAKRDAERLKRKETIEQKAKENLKIPFRPMDILNYLGALFYLVLAISAIINGGYLASIVFLSGVIIFIPYIGNLIISKNGFMKENLYIARGVILLIGAFVLAVETLESEPKEYEGVWISEQGTTLTISEENIIVEKIDGSKITTTYREQYVNPSKDELIDYYYKLKTEEKNKNKTYLTFKYTYYLDEKKELCLLDRKECVEYFTFKEKTTTNNDNDVNSENKEEIKKEETKKEETKKEETKKESK